MVTKSKLSEAKSMYCAECGTNMSDKAKACPKCGAPVAGTTTEISNLDGLALLCSFFVPGLGHAIKGRIGKGIGLFILFIIGLCFFILPGIIVWLYAMIDAYKIKKVN